MPSAAAMRHISTAASQDFGTVVDFRQKMAVDVDHDAIYRLEHIGPSGDRMIGPSKIKCASHSSTSPLANGGQRNQLLCFNHPMTR